MSIAARHEWHPSDSPAHCRPAVEHPARQLRRAVRTSRDTSSSGLMPRSMAPGVKGIMPPAIARKMLSDSWGDSTGSAGERGAHQAGGE